MRSMVNHRSLFLPGLICLLLCIAGGNGIVQAAGLPDAEWQRKAQELILEDGWQRLEEEFFPDREDVDYEPIAFGIYDFNLDGTPEIIANNGEESYAGNVDYVYLCGGDGVRSAGVLGAGEIYYYDQTSSYPGIFAAGAHTGAYWTEYVTLENDRMERSRVVSYEDLSNPGVRTEDFRTEDAALFAAWEQLDSGGSPKNTLELTPIKDIAEMGFEAFLARYGFHAESVMNAEMAEKPESLEKAGFADAPERGEAMGNSESVFQLMVEDVTFDEAFEKAKAAGGSLALPKNRQDYDRLISQIQAENLSDKIFFLGGRRAPDSTVYHDLKADGSSGDLVLNDPSFWGASLWMEGEPSFRDGEIEESCLELYQKDGEFVLNDVPADILKVIPGWSGRIGYVIEYRPSGEETSEILSPESVLRDVPEKFYFSSGAGGWETDLELHDDGSFSGEYHDSNMGENVENYPGGTVYLCPFTGAFTDFRKVDDYSYSCRLKSLNYDEPADLDYEEEGIHFIGAEPYGIAGGDLFMIYLPGHPISTLPEGFLSWARMYMGYPDESVRNLTVYGLYNVAEWNGFGGSFD